MSRTLARNLPLVCLAVVLGLYVAIVAATYTLLPDRVASHFSAAGKPDGWMSRRAFVSNTLAVAGLVTAQCVGALYVCRFLPDSLINIPHRDYWLAPERRGETHARLLAFGLWLSCLVVALFIGLHLLTVRANRSQPVAMPITDGLALMAAFLVGLGLLCYRLCVRGWRIAPSSSYRNAPSGSLSTPEKNPTAEVVTATAGSTRT